MDSWFKSEILVHEEVLMRFLARVWPRREEHADLRQEAYIRTYEAALKTLPRNPKAFLFSIARHIMVDRIRRERIVSIQTAGIDFSSELLEQLIEENTPERSENARQQLMRLANAFDQLPTKCRDVVWMRKVLEISQRDVAQRQGVSEKTIEKQVCRGVRLLASYMHQVRDTNHPDTQSRAGSPAAPPSASGHELDEAHGFDEQDTGP